MRPVKPSAARPPAAGGQRDARQLLMDFGGSVRRQPRERGPGLSRSTFRLVRLWKKPWVRRTAICIVPAVALALALGRLAGDPEIRRSLEERARAAVAALSARPEFAVRGLSVSGGSTRLQREIVEAVRLPPGASSLALDIASVRARVAGLGAVRSARVSLGSDGLLLIDVEERVAEALWRDGDGTLWRVGRDGVTVGPAGERSDHADLPVVLGQDAPEVMAQALSLLRSAPSIRPRLRALVRVGGRRWDAVLDRGLTIMLPERGAEAALARLMALHWGEELLDRDLAVIDMRLGDRPTLRLTGDALRILRLRESVDGPGEET